MCPYYNNGCKVRICIWNTSYFYPDYVHCAYYNEIKRKIDFCSDYCKETKRKDELPMENKTLEKTLDVAGSVAKIAANLSDTKKEPAPRPRPYYETDDNSNKASTGSQTVVVSMDGKKKEPKPVEKHIHTFPENRALTKEECDLDLEKARMEYNLKKKEQEYTAYTADREWNHKLEQERKNAKRQRIRNIIAGVVGLCCAGGIGYSIYADYRDHKNMGVVKTETPTEPVKADGTVK